MNKITRIVTHRFPDLDALLCCWLLRRFGESRYPGIAEVPIDFWNAGDLPEGKTPEDLEREGTLLVDTGGGAWTRMSSKETLAEGRRGRTSARRC